MFVFHTHRFTTDEAAPVIKSFSPDLMVDPILPSKTPVCTLLNSLSGMTVQRQGAESEPSESSSTLLNPSYLEKVLMYYDSIGLSFRTKADRDKISQLLSQYSYPQPIVYHQLFDVLFSTVPSILFDRMKRNHAIVIGPGMGQDELTQAISREVLIKLKPDLIPTILDAGDLSLPYLDLDKTPYLRMSGAPSSSFACSRKSENAPPAATNDHSRNISETIKITSGFESLVLTPNVREFQRLYEYLALDSSKLEKIKSSTEDTNETIGKFYEYLLQQGANTEKKKLHKIIYREAFKDIDMNDPEIQKMINSPYSLDFSSFLSTSGEENLLDHAKKIAQSSSNLQKFIETFQGVFLLVEAAHLVAQKLQGPTIVVKGPVDLIVSPTRASVVIHPGSPRRCGGLGDVLCGVLAIFCGRANAKIKSQESRKNQFGSSLSSVSDAIGAGATLACLTSRAAQFYTYRKNGRTMVASDVAEKLGTIVDDKKLFKVLTSDD